MTEKLEFSVTCSGCGTKHVAQDNHPLGYIAARRAEGWEIPDAIENKPIKCPTCKTK